MKIAPTFVPAKLDKTGDERELGAVVTFTYVPDELRSPPGACAQSAPFPKVPERVP